MRRREDARRIVAAVGVQAADAVVEVGPGLGDLTRELAGPARKVVGIELDRGLMRALAEAGLPENVEIRHGDVLKVDLLGLGRELGAPAVLVGNLPYRVAGRLIGQLLSAGEVFARFRRLGFMMQAEVAERLIAREATPAYSSLSVWAGLYARPRRVLEFGPNAFVPRPKVHSAFVLLDPPAVSPEVSDPALLERVVTAAFRFRRKTLRRALQSLADASSGRDGSGRDGSVNVRTRSDETRGDTAGGLDAGAALAAAGIDGQRRGETLSPAEFVRLAAALAAQPVRG